MSTHRKGIRIAAHLILWLALGLAFQLTLNPGSVFADPPPSPALTLNITSPTGAVNEGDTFTFIIDRLRVVG